MKQVMLDGTKRRTIRRMTLASLLGVVVVVGGIYGGQVVLADVEPTEEAYRLTRPPNIPTTQHNVFTLYPADDGAQRYEDLSRVEKSGIDGLRAYYGSRHHGKAVHDAYRRGSRTRIRYQKLRRAERTAGLGGIADLGVR